MSVFLGQFGDIPPTHFRGTLNSQFGLLEYSNNYSEYGTQSPSKYKLWSQNYKHYKNIDHIEENPAAFYANLVCSFTSTLAGRACNFHSRAFLHIDVTIFTKLLVLKVLSQ